MSVRKADLRNARTEEAIKQAFLELLASKPFTQITMVDVAAKADVSRSTLYAHYPCIADIYDDVFRNIPARNRPLAEQLSCSECPADAQRQPFCTRLREAGEYAPLYRDPQFMDRLLASDEGEGDDIGGLLADSRLDEEQKKALQMFQMSGCYAVATKLDTKDWPRIRRTLDAFIRGGIEAVRQERL